MVKFHYFVFFVFFFFSSRRRHTRLVSDWSSDVCSSDLLLDRGHQVIPLIVIVAVLMSGYSAPYAALWGCITVFPIALLRSTTRGDVRPSKILDRKSVV